MSPLPLLSIGQEVRVNAKDGMFLATVSNPDRFPDCSSLAGMCCSVRVGSLDWDIHVDRADCFPGSELKRLASKLKDEIRCKQYELKSIQRLLKPQRSVT